MAEAKKESTIEREYTIPLRKKIRVVPRYKKTNKAVKSIKEFLARHMKVYDRDLNKIKIDKYLNEYLWFRGIRNPPHKVKVKAIKDGDIVRVELAEMTRNLKFKKMREEKREQKSRDSLQKTKPALQKTSEAPQTSKESEAEKTKEKSEEVSKTNLEQEKKSATIENKEKFEKEEHKKAKHTTTPKSPKEEKNSRKEYNKSSRGK